MDTAITAHHQKRLRAERRFKLASKSALAFALLALIILLGSIFARGIGGVFAYEVTLPITFDASEKGKPASAYIALAQHALKERFPEVTDLKERKMLYSLLGASTGAVLKKTFKHHPEWEGKTVSVSVPLASTPSLYLKGDAGIQENGKGGVTSLQAAWLNTLEKEHALKRHFNTRFFTRADSRYPEQAGFLGAIMGSLLTLAVCFALSFPLGVMTAVYLEEFAKKSRLVDVLEVNINNLAAVPSIVFGLLGLSIYLNVLHLPRSAPLVGGLTLALMILPVIIITTRAALRAIPGSIRDAARALGASPLQVVLHHTLPLSMPGIMTGTILGLARAIGETAPLLMIGMVAFIADVPGHFTDPATAMPVQIYLWASSPEAGYAEKTGAGIIVLLAILLAMNAIAIFLRKRFEIRW